MLKRTLYGAAVVLAGSIGLALAAAGPTTLANLWNFGGFHNGIVGLAVQDGSGNIAPEVGLVDKNGAPNDATHPVFSKWSAAADVCQDPNIAKSSAIINIGAAATTKIVDAVSGKQILVCSWSMSLAGTTPTLTFKYGTHVTTDCDTGATSLSGAYAPSSGTYMAEADGAVKMAAPASNQLCGTTSGTGSSAQGRLSYVQQ